MKQAIKSIYEENKTMKKAFQYLYKLFKEIDTKSPYNITEEFELSHTVDYISECASRSLQIEKRLKVTEEKARTVLIDCSTREKMLIEDINQLHSSLDESKNGMDNMNEKVKIMEDKFIGTVRFSLD
jgi:hypothetical protein